jgi:N-acyl homoserine lactone hydrolase
MMRLYVLPLGTVEVDVQKFMAWEPDRGERYSGPATGFLIQTDDGVNVLVDTGLSPEHVENPEARSKQPDVVVTMRPEDDVRHRLKELGLSPEDVHYVIQTHLDFDHCGGNQFFPNAIFVLQREHYEYARAHPERCPPQDWDIPELHYRLIDGDQELLPGIELVTTPGHAPGHQSVILRRLQNTGTVILSADAAHTHREFEEELVAGTPEDADLIASIRKLKLIRDAENAVLITCHDVDAWNDEYRISPDYYD